MDSEACDEDGWGFLWRSVDDGDVRLLWQVSLLGLFRPKWCVPLCLPTFDSVLCWYYLRFLWRSVFGSGCRGLLPRLLSTSTRFNVWIDSHTRHTFHFFSFPYSLRLASVGNVLMIAFRMNFMVHSMFWTIVKSNENASENLMHTWNQDPMSNFFFD